MASVLHIGSQYFNSKSNPLPNPPTSPLLKPKIVNYFVEQERRIKFLGTVVRIMTKLKEKKENKIEVKMRKIITLEPTLEKLEEIMKK